MTQKANLLKQEVVQISEGYPDLRSKRFGNDLRSQYNNLRSLNENRYEEVIPILQEELQVMYHANTAIVDKRITCQKHIDTLAADFNNLIVDFVKAVLPNLKKRKKKETI